MNNIDTQLSFGFPLALGDPALSGNVQLTREQVNQTVSEAADAITTYSVQKRDKSLDKAGAALDTLDQEFDAREQSLRANGSTMPDATGRKSAEALHDLRRRRQDDVTAGLARAFEGLKAAWTKTPNTQGKGGFAS
jgi:hypothetical protein